MGGRVLIVEDEVISAMALEGLLSDLGYSVVGTATTGEEAIEKARRERPDLVAMDIRLAGRMNGIEAAARISEETAARLVFMTGYDDADTRSRALGLRPLAFLTKPIDRRKIKAALGPSPSLH